MRKLLLVSSFAAIVAVCGFACSRQSSQAAGEETAAAPASSAPAVVEIVARDFSLQAPDSVPSGWTTFRLRNAGHQPHFVQLTLLPEGKTLDDYRTEVGPPFDDVWAKLQAGSIDKATAAQELGASLPDWYLTGARYMGGPGLVTPGHTVRTTLELSPGSYVMECYIKSPDGTFHGELGMLHPLTVTTASSDAGPPSADLEITLTNDRIAVDGEPAPGEQTIAVHFQEQPPAGLGNDVHLARLGDDTDLEALAAWMDWMNVDGMRQPAPVEFLGGAEEMPAGSTEYFTVTLEPGRYAWISEPVTSEGKLQVFTVEPAA